MTSFLLEPYLHSCQRPPKSDCFRQLNFDQFQVLGRVVAVETAEVSVFESVPVCLKTMTSPWWT